MVVYIYGRPLVIARLSWIKLKIIAWQKNTHTRKHTRAFKNTHTKEKKTITYSNPRWGLLFYYFIPCLCLFFFLSIYSSVHPLMATCPSHYQVSDGHRIIQLYIFYDSIKYQAITYTIFIFKYAINAFFFHPKKRREKITRHLWPNKKLIHINATQCV